MSTNKLYAALITFVLLLTTLLINNLTLGQAASESTHPLDPITDNAPANTQLYDDENLDHDVSVMNDDASIAATQPAWEKEIWIGGNAVALDDSPFCDLLATDVISIVDSVMVASASDTFTLTEEWSESLVFTDVQHTGGTVTPMAPPIPGPGTVTWTVQSATANTLYVLTKTFTVATSGGDVDYITETLQVDASIAQPDDIHLTFWHAGAACVDIDAVDFDFSPSMPRVNADVDFFGSVTPSCVTLPNYVWNFDDGSTAEGSSTWHSFSAPLAELPKTFTVTLTATNSCSSEQTSREVTIQPWRYYMSYVANEG